MRATQTGSPQGAASGSEQVKRATVDQNVLCNSSGAGSVPPRPIDMKLLKSPRNKAVQRSCNWLSALRSEVGKLISSEPKSSCGAKPHEKAETVC
jgi:hypothetical protein